MITGLVKEKSQTQTQCTHCNKGTDSPICSFVGKSPSFLSLPRKPHDAFSMSLSHSDLQTEESSLFFEGVSSAIFYCAAVFATCLSTLACVSDHETQGWGCSCVWCPRVAPLTCRGETSAGQGFLPPPSCRFPGLAETRPRMSEGANRAGPWGRAQGAGQGKKN